MSVTLDQIAPLGGVTEAHALLSLLEAELRRHGNQLDPATLLEFIEANFSQFANAFPENVNMKGHMEENSTSSQSRKAISNNISEAESSDTASLEAPALSEPAPSAAPISDDNIDDDLSLPVVPIEKYVSPEQAMSSGAVSLEDDLPGQLGEFEDDDTHCNLNTAPEIMPFKVIRARELRRMDMGLSNSSTIKNLSDDFITTYLGLKLARTLALRKWEEVKFFIPEANEADNQEDWNALCISALEATGGVAPERGQQIIYPEEIIPRELARRKGNGGWTRDDEIEVRDRAYWDELQSQGEVWQQMPEIPDWRQMRRR